MKIECTPTELTDFVTEVQSRLNKFETIVKLDEVEKHPTLYVAKDNEEYFTLDRNKAKLDLCGCPFIVHF